MDNRSVTLIEKEKQQNHWLYSTYLILVVSGFVTWVWQTQTVFTQWLVLVHCLAGLLFTVILLPFTLTHFRRTLGQRRPGLILSGIILTFTLGYLTVTGLHIIWRGQTEVQSWRLVSHVIAAGGSVALLLGHIIAHRYFLPKRRLLSEHTKTFHIVYFPSLPSTLRRTLMLAGSSVIGLTVLLTLVYSTLTNEPDAVPAVADYQYPYGNHPFRPSQTETKNTAFIDKKAIALSESCADCHTDIAQQWKSSMHKQAASDPAYVTNISLLAATKGIAATRYCEGCHAPVALLTGQLSEGGTHGGVAGTLAFNEGISCLSCHSMANAVHLKGVASFKYTPHSPYLFYGHHNPLLKTIHHFLLRVNTQQHRLDMARPILKNPKMCATCHAQFMDKDMNNWGWVKMQDEYTDWLNSPFSKQNEQRFSHSEVTRCQDCHMPLAKGQDPSANKEGKLRSHRFLGANTMMPTLNNDHEQFLQTKAFLQNNKVRITIEKPYRLDATQSKKVIDESLRSTTKTPAYYYLNESADIRVIVTNNGVGHNFPGGTLDVNEAWVDFNVTDATGKSIYHSGFMQDDLHVDPKAYFYRSKPIDRYGNEIWKHDLFNRVGETYKNFVPAGKSDIIAYQFEVPSWAEGPITVTAVLKYRKLNQRYALWALKDKYKVLPVIAISRHTIQVPIREQAPIKKL